MVSVVAVALAVSSCSSGSDTATATSSSEKIVTSATRSSPASPVAGSSGLPSQVAPGVCEPVRLKNMTLRDKLAQMLMVGVTGSEDAASVLQNSHVGGVFVGSWTDKSMLTSGDMKRIAAASPTPPMVSVDQEGGRVSRLASIGIDFPSARELAATRTTGQVRAIARDAAVKMRELGITVDFAPDVDVSDEPDDAVIGDRSFSNDPQVVARYGAAFADGLRDGGILPVFKHFPGHGHGSGDSHLGTVTTPPLSQLMTSDLVPYRSVLTQPSGVLVGHLIVPGLTEPQTPASLSPAAMSLLRNGTGYGGNPFTGPIFTDDLSSMAAISARYSVEEAVTKALTAGADIALWITTDQVPAVLNALQGAVRSGRLTMEKVNASVTRILTAKGLGRC